jgi:hypothetical protein
MPNTFEEVATVSKERAEKIAAIDSQITEVNNEIAKFKEKYPQLFLENRQYFPTYLEQLKSAERSEWKNDEVKITAYKEGEGNDLPFSSKEITGLIMENITQKEKIEGDILVSKIKAADEAFKLVGMTEHTEAYKKSNAIAAIEKEKEVCDKLTESLYEKTKRHSSLTESPRNPEASLLQVIHLTRSNAEKLAHSGKTYGEIFEATKTFLQNSTKPNPETELVEKTVQELIAKTDDLTRQKREL